MAVGDAWVEKRQLPNHMKQTVSCTCVHTQVSICVCLSDYPHLSSNVCVCVCVCVVCVCVCVCMCVVCVCVTSRGFLLFVFGAFFFFSSINHSTALISKGSKDG